MVGAVGVDATKSPEPSSDEVIRTGALASQDVKPVGPTKGVERELPGLLKQGIQGIDELREVPGILRSVGFKRSRGRDLGQEQGPVEDPEFQDIPLRETLLGNQVRIEIDGVPEGEIHMKQIFPAG
jgi:hypothetical protein